MSAAEINNTTQFFNDDNTCHTETQTTSPNDDWRVEELTLHGVGAHGGSLNTSGSRSLTNIIHTKTIITNCINLAANDTWP